MITGADTEDKEHTLRVFTIGGSDHISSSWAGGVDQAFKFESSQYVGVGTIPKFTYFLRIEAVVPDGQDNRANISLDDLLSGQAKIDRLGRTDLDTFIAGKVIWWIVETIFDIN